MATELAGRFPRQRFVLDHLAKPDIRAGEIRAWAAERADSLPRCPNVWCKLSGLVTEADWAAWTPEQLRPYLDVAFEGFGADRLMIGSDWPVCTVASDYARTMAVVVEYLARSARAANATPCSAATRSDSGICSTVERRRDPMMTITKDTKTTKDTKKIHVACKKSLTAETARERRKENDTSAVQNLK